MPVVGEPVRQAIDRFVNLNVFSSTRLLPRRLTVQAPPDSSADPRTQIRQLLEPHGLTLVMTDRTTGYVSVYEPPQETPPGKETTPAPVTQPYIEEVTVYAPFRVDRTIRPQSLTRRHLDLIPSVGGDTFRALHILPGVASDGVSAMHRIRGGDSNEVLYRLDGVDLYQPFHFSDVRSLFAAVNPNVVDSVDVYVSGFPSRFGTRMSGVVDVHLVEPQRPLHGTVELSALAAAADGRGYAGSWSWLASARRSLVGDVLAAIGVAGDEHPEIPRFDDQLARLQWSGTNDELVLGVFRRSETVDVERESTGERARASVGHEDFWVRWDHDFDGGLRTIWQASRFAGDRTRGGTTEQGEEASGRLSERRLFRISAVANQWRWTPRRDTEVNAGWAHVRHRADLSASLEMRYGPVGLPVQNALRESRDLALDRSGSSGRAFASFTRDLTDGLTASIGARYDRLDVGDVDADDWSGRIALVFHASSAWQVDLDLGRYRQPQFLHEIQIGDGRTELDSPQHADQVNAGVVWSAGPRLKIRSDVYARRIERPWPRFENLYHRFGLLPELGGDRYLIEAGEARSRGIELAASYAGGRFGWKLAYARTSSKERIADTWHRRSWDQPHSVKAHVSWSGDAWRIGLDAAYRSGWPVTPLVTRTGQLPANLNADRLPAYLSFGVHVAGIVSTRLGPLEVYGDVTNATNRRNVVGYLYDPELSRRDGLSLPIVPSIGVRWSW